MKQKLTYAWRYLFWNFQRLYISTFLNSHYNVHFDSNCPKLPKPPFVMVANHGTFFDPWLVGQLSWYPLSIMMNEEGFRNKPFTQWYQTQIGCFAKKKGASDFKAMKTTLKNLGNGYPVLIFPEGQTTWDGETQPLYPGVEKILKKSGSRLVMVHLKGNFLSRPWWADSFRKGRVLISWKVVDVPTVHSLSEQELRDLIISYLYQNDIKDEDNYAIPFHGKNLAAGLERFVWICRQCGAEDTLTTSADSISCQACGASWVIDALCRFTPAHAKTVEIGDLHDWSSWHKEIIREKLKTMPTGAILTANERILYGKTSPHGEWETIACGSLQLLKSEITFTGAPGTDVSLRLPVPEIVDYIFQRKDLFECSYNGTDYRFRFMQQSPMKWVYYLRILNGYDECQKRGYL